MKKIFLSLLASAALASGLHAQSINWTSHSGGLGYQEAHDLAVDADGNVITVGYFQGTIDLDPGAGTAYFSCAGGYDIFIQKVDADGNYLWGGKIGGGSSSEDASGVAFDADGNVLVTGKFDETCDFDITASSSSMAGLAGTSDDIFVLKLSPDGDYLWSVPAAGTGQDLGKEIAADAAGNVFVGGTFRSTCEFADMSGGTDSYTSWGVEDVFVWKLSPTGFTDWVHIISSTGTDNLDDLEADGSSVLAIGTFENNLDQDGLAGSGSTLIASAGGQDIFILDMDTTGATSHVATLGAPANDRAYAVARDAAGNVLLAGGFAGTFDFDPGAGTEMKTTIAGLNDGFLLSLDNTLAFDWVKTTEAAGSDHLSDVNVSASGDIWVAGNFLGALDANLGADSMVFVSTYATGMGNGYMAHMDAAANFIWAGHLAGDGNSIRDLKTGPGGVAVSGYFQDSMNVDFGAGLAYVIADEFTDAFTVHVDLCPAFSPSISFSAPTLSTDAGFASYQWLLSGSPIGGATSSTYDPTTSGVYSVEMTDSAGCTYTSDTLMVVITALNEAATGTALTLSPNPTSGRFTLSCVGATATTHTLRVMDLAGRVITELQASPVAGQLQLELDLSAQTAGMYLIELSNGSSRSFARIVKQ